MKPRTRSVAVAVGSVALAAVAACTARVGAELSVGGTDPAAGQGMCCSNNYAAMAEVPVQGGELRLAEVMVTPGRVGDGAAEPTPQRQIAFPLQHTDVRVHVAEMMAQYTVEQTFANPFDQAIDAVYVFPLGDEAAVSGFRMTVGERTILGEIKKRDDARETYESARRAGHTTALVEQEQANVFAQRIANIAPKETIKVRFEYTELLDFTDGQYQLTFPFVVAPRYLPQEAVGEHPVGSHRAGAAGRPGVTSIPYTDKRDAGTVSFTAQIDAGVPIKGVTSPSHDIAVNDVSPTRMNVALQRTGEVPNRDLVLRYQVASPATMVGVLAHRAGDHDGAFVLVVQPKADYKTGDIAARDMVIVIDTSGSMDGQPIEQAKTVARGLVDTLTPRDTLSVIAFAGGIEMMAPAPIAADAAGVKRGRDYITNLASGGGTEMHPALVSALASDPGNDRVRIVYFLTDGQIGNDDVVLGAARGLGHNRIFPVGIGSAPNRHLLDRLADLGRGFPSYLSLTEEAKDLVPELVRRSAYPYLTNIKINWGGLAVRDLTPSVVPDVYAGMPLVISGKYEKPGSATVTLSGFTAGRPIAIPVNVTLPARHDLPPIGSLWARRRITAIQLAAAGAPLSAPSRQEITEIGLRYHLVTAETSFVAVDRTRVVQPGGATKIVEQPVMIPEGVNIDTAVGAEADPAAAYYGGGTSGASDDSGSWGGGGGGGGGAVDALTLVLALLVLPLAWTLRRLRAGA